MSVATKRKHVTREVMNDYILPEGNQSIVKIVSSKGNNLHEVETANEKNFLVSMPSKFRKNVWIKRGDFVIVEPIEEGVKVKAEIIAILMKKQIKHIQQEGYWPPQFQESAASGQETNCLSVDKHSESVDSDSDNGESSEESDDDSDLFVNTNQHRVYYSEDEDLTDEYDNDETQNETEPQNESEITNKLLPETDNAFQHESAEPANNTENETIR